GRRASSCVRSSLRSFFFFSSRRRHTRFSRDWSSDVCSSDLFAYRNGLNLRGRFKLPVQGQALAAPVLGLREHALVAIGGGKDSRSEERRVGKEGRWRAEPYRPEEKRHGAERREVRRQRANAA